MAFSITPQNKGVSEAGSFVRFTVSRSSTGDTETVYFSTILNGTANNNDYTSVYNQPLTFLPGMSSQEISVLINNDSVPEPNETFGVIVQQTPNPDVNVFLDRAFLTIQNDDVVHDGTGLNLVAEYPTTLRTYTPYISGQYAYVADQYAGLLIFDIADPTHPVLVGSHRTGLPGTLDSRAASVVVSGNYAYVGDEDSFLNIFDVSNPASPLLLSTYNGPTDSFVFPYTLAISRTYIFAPVYIEYTPINKDGAVYIIDVSDPNAPSLAGSLTTGLVNPYAVIVSEQYAYVGDQGTGKISIFDVSDISAPFLAGTYGGVAPSALKLIGNHLYVADAGGGFYILDVAEVTNPTLVGSYDGSYTAPPPFSNVVGGIYYGVDVVGDFALLTDKNDSGKVIALDISNPASPLLVDVLPLGHQPWALAVSGEYAYVGNSSGGLAIIHLGTFLSASSSPPVPSDIIQDAHENIGNPVMLAALFTDADLNDTFTFLVDATGTVGQVVSNGDGTFNYNPNGMFEYLGLGETAIDKFSWTVTDNHGAASTANATITIHGANDAPVALSDIAMVQKGKTVVVNVAQGILANDRDPDVHDALRVSSISFGNDSSAIVGGSATISGAYGNLVVAADGSYSYAANKNIPGLTNKNAVQEQFSYTIDDGHGGAATSTLAITVQTQQALNQAPVFSIKPLDANKIEGNGGTTPFTFVVNREGNASGTSAVNWTVGLSTTATVNGDDFVGSAFPSGTVTFGPGQLTKTIIIDVRADGLYENNGKTEKFAVTLSGPTGGATISSTHGNAVGQIQNDDTREQTFLSIHSLTESQAEGSAQTTSYAFVVTRTGDLSAPSTVYWAVGANQDPDADRFDFAGKKMPNGAVTFAAGEFSKTVSVGVNGDLLPESGGLPESFVVTLTKVSGPAIIDPLRATATAQIHDDDLIPFLAKLSNWAYLDGVDVAGALKGDMVKADFKLLSRADLPSLPKIAIDQDGALTTFQQGVYTHDNAAALIGRSGNSLFLAFRGTDDFSGNMFLELVKGYGGDSTQDVNDWFQMDRHYELFDELFVALDNFIAQNGISHVYVTGHSLGAAMAQRFMQENANDARFEAVTFANPGYVVADLSGEMPPSGADGRIINIHVAGDPAEYTQLRSVQWIGDYLGYSAGEAGDSITIQHADISGNLHDPSLYEEIGRFLGARYMVDMNNFDNTHDDIRVGAAISHPSPDTWLLS